MFVFFFFVIYFIFTKEKRIFFYQTNYNDNTLINNGI